MIKARHFAPVYFFFKAYTFYKMKRSFGSVITDKFSHDRSRAVLLIGNHISWWDGFWALYLSLKLFDRKFYFMMLESELRKRWLFSYSGGFSIAPGTRSVIRSLRYTAELLRDKNNLVLMFPRGKIQSLYNFKTDFEQGVGYVLSISDPKPDIVFLVSMTEYFDHPKPDIYFHLEKYNDPDLSANAIQIAYQAFAERCRIKHCEMSV